MCPTLSSVAPEGAASGSAPLERSLRVLELLAAGGSAVGASEVARRLALPRQSAHRLLGQLEVAGLAQRALEGGFVPGPRLRALALSTLGTGWRGGPVRQVLRDLVADVGESCNLGVLDRDEVVYVERVECDWPLRVQLGVGSRVPLHATGIGKLLLAHLPARARRRVLAMAPFERFTPNTLTTAEALESAIARIRADGYAVNEEENTLGLVGVAVPVRDDVGRVVAGLSLHAPAARTPLDRAVAHLPVLQRAADRLRPLLGAQQED